MLFSDIFYTRTVCRWLIWCVDTEIGDVWMSAQILHVRLWITFLVLTSFHGWRSAFLQPQILENVSGMSSKADKPANMCVHVCACILLQARGKTSKFEVVAPQPLHKKSCSEWTMCTGLHRRDWADRVFSLLGKEGYMCVCLETRTCGNWLLCSDENGVHRRTKWYVSACLLLLCVCTCVEVLGSFFSVLAYVWVVSMLDSAKLQQHS